VPADVLRSADSRAPINGAIRPYAASLEEFERQALAEAMAAAHGRVEEAAKLLGLGRATLYRKLRALGIASQ
jgi:transcriptional regulator of acetoin/glycerol metabolism